MIVRFATICDYPGCTARSPEYTRWASCDTCGSDTCPAHEVPGTHDDGDGQPRCTCRQCEEIDELPSESTSPQTGPVSMKIGDYAEWDERAEMLAWAKRSAECRDRDKHTCRICTCQTTKWGKGDPRTWGAAHHIRYRSAGGSDDLSNLVWVCFTCHERIHKAEIHLSGTSEQLWVTDPFTARRHREAAP